MNQHMKKLADQARFTHQVPYPSEDEVFQKFGELLVREYEKFLSDICPWADAHKEGPMKGWHVQFVARKHFGVE